ncbi:uncharacterized protein LOC121735745 [Aricia agestis]|uniref:uncharacterized protein LOC121735745 n=1 Tax=Aricia agestis TaxID=91739 RepID=UPI001C208A1F|nr:uncharacterized protein LOC121735745 [Aricia agestis]
MSREDFEDLLSKVNPFIMKKDIQLREAVPAKIRLALTLRFLASGDSYESLHFLFKISPQLISQIVPEVYEALNKVLKDEIKIPSSKEEWIEIEKGYKNKFPRCIGSLHVKHVVIECPANSGSEYYNYKKDFSIVLLALVDCNYNFIFADIGSNGRMSDGGIFRDTKLWNKIATEALNLPDPHPLPGSDKYIPYVLLADSAFAFHKNVMKPYPGIHNIGNPKRIFNDKLSRSRVIVENTFGVLCTKFRIFWKAICAVSRKSYTYYFDLYTIAQLPKKK